MLRLFLILLLFIPVVSAAQKRGVVAMYGADHPFIRYTGRIDFTYPQLPRFWQPGVYITLRIRGTGCSVVLNDEERWGKNHNYLELTVDGKPTRIQTKAARDTIFVRGLKPGEHTIVLTKNTEANIGYLELVQVMVWGELIEPAPARDRTIEFIGNSITCGASSDPSSVPCGKGVWHDQHNAYFSYGANTARGLNADYHLSAVSGIGLMHSCCGMNIIMPRVFDKVNMSNDTIAWDFSNYQPDLVTVCLGQNDGIQDSAAFTDHYITFVKRLRAYYPNAMIVCLSSPMADASLKEFMVKTITAALTRLRETGDQKIRSYFFRKQYDRGCDYHPNLAEHREIGDELTAFIRKTMQW